MGFSIQHYAQRKCDRCEKITAVTLFVIPIQGQQGHNRSIALCHRCMENKFPSTDGTKPIKNQYARYKMSSDDYDQILQSQNGVCAVCKKPETRYLSRLDRIMPLVVDHDHVTGLVRALLCSKCNIALGLLEEDPERIESLARYIRKYKK